MLNRRLFTAALAWLTLTVLNNTVQAQPVHLLLGLVALAFLFPARPAVGALALAARIATNLAKGPWMGNSQPGAAW